MRVALAHSWRERERGVGGREREDEFAFVYNIYACAHGRACAHVCGVGVCV